MSIFVNFHKRKMWLTSKNEATQKVLNMWKSSKGRVNVLWANIYILYITVLIFHSWSDYARYHYNFYFLWFYWLFMCHLRYFYYFSFFYIIVVLHLVVNLFRGAPKTKLFNIMNLHTLKVSLILNWNILIFLLACWYWI